MNYPYTTQPLDALMVAQTSAGLMLGAVAWGRRMRPWPAAAFFLAAIAVATVLPVEGDFLRGLGMTLTPEHGKHVLKIVAAMATVAALFTRQRRLVILALLGEAALWPITDYIQDCDPDLAVAHLTWLGFLVGMYRRIPVQVSPDLAGRGTREPASAPASASVSAAAFDLLRDFWVEDGVIFGIATVAACLVCWLVLHGHTDSADEWANTFQAALFAKFRAYGSVPHCSEALRSFYVFQYMGRSFSQYTPGWPYFMVPFMVFRVPWLAGPASLGVLAAGVARLGRRAAAGFAPGTEAPPAAHVRAAGRFAALALVLSSTVLVNGASRYPHIFVAAMFAWALEALCVVADGGLGPREQRQWGAVLGACIALTVAARPPDGATLGFGMFVYFVYALIRRRIGWQAVGMAAAVAAFIGGVTLVVLRLQLGVWFKTAYAIVDLIYPWAKVAWSLPKPNEFRWGIPLAAGSYCWSPCSPAVGMAGIALLRGRARRLAFVFFMSTIALLAMYTMLELGRGYDFGYGPRYELPLIVPMAVGMGVVFAKLFSLASQVSAAPAAWLSSFASEARSWLGGGLAAGGPIAVAMLAMGLGVIRMAPLMYLHTYAEVHEHNRLHDAIDTTAPKNAVIVAGSGLNMTDPMDLTENLPLELYPNQDVIIAIDRGPDETRCVQEKFKGRTFYRTIPGDPVRLVRW
ncbi:MAG TPA: hypothetical protein VII82_15025 [Polyangiaceae bacterium]